LKDVNSEKFAETYERIRDGAMREPAPITRIEPRWPVALAIVAVILLLALLPNRVRVVPTWVPSRLGFAMIVPMVAVSLTTAKALWLRIESIITVLFVVIGGLGVLDELRSLLYAMLRRPGDITGVQLLTSSIVVWASNVLLFSVTYWWTDRGGPEARANHRSTKPDWLFPTEGAPPEDVPDNWRPTFIDYLFLSYCTATAFSPAEAQPVTSRGKLLLMLESIVSLVTILAIAARAINILTG
jgi:hypothetical protein